MPFTFETCEISEVVLVTPKVFGDDRGYFMETYKKSDWEKRGLPSDFTQDNQSFSKAGVLRGLHYQSDPFAQGKLVRVLSGSIFDVAVDVRENSPTFGQWVARTLTAQNKQMLWVPKGFAHGFLTLENDTSVFYKCTGEYQPSHEKSIRWDDPTLAIDWPKMPEYSLSDKDQIAPFFSDVFGGKA